MSIHVMNLVWKNAPCQGNALLALLALADWSDDEGKSWPSVVTLAKKSRQSERNCHTVIRELESLKLIEIKHRDGTSNMFSINLELLGGMQSLHPAKTSKRGGLRVQTLHEPLAKTAPYTSDTSKNQDHTSTSLFPETEDQSKAEPVRAKETKKQQQKSALSTDGRHHSIMKAIIDGYRLKNGERTPAIPLLGRRLKEWIKSHGEWTADDVVACVRNRFLSEVNHAQEPYIWILNLAAYTSGPLDKYGKPKGMDNGKSRAEESIEANRRTILSGLLGEYRVDSGPDGSVLPAEGNKRVGLLLERGASDSGAGSDS